jgi:glycosyltransferase involved in cell wall biosynthesis
MVMSKSLSIIIPVYNEELQLENCLRSIEAQTVQPDEVIVVDNNSTDRSVEIARKFAFVRVVHESHQGRGFAYSTGFNAAKSDILGRINGDSILLPDWVERVKRDFEDTEDASPLRGVTGLGVTETIPIFKSWTTTIWSRGYYWWNLADFRVQMFWGPCFAVDRQAWLEVRDRICTDDTLVHDDQDLAYLFAGRGFRVKLDTGLRIRMSGRHYSYWPKFREYRHRQFTTYRLHKEKKTLDNPEACVAPWWLPVIITVIGIVPLAGFYTASIIQSLLQTIDDRFASNN